MAEKDILQDQSILSNIQASDDVKKLTAEQLPALCEEIRSKLIKHVSHNGGHLASNLGVVELTVAIHRVFDSLTDHIIFDVGHQSYVHKMLTGRADLFDTLRCPGGISGFPKREESPHDAFGTGHASTSLSAGLGFACADQMQGKDNYTVVVLGDGAFTGGMIHEALNNCNKNLKLILIINENEMSISKNIGHFAQELAHLRTRPGYFRTKTAIERILGHIPLVGKPTKRMVSSVKNALKESLYGSNYFENMGLRYLGPADGNRLPDVEALLQRAKASGKACVIHLKTLKGKGYEPAVLAPAKYHALPPSDKKLNQDASGKTFSQVFGQTLIELAHRDPSICAITAAMKNGTGLRDFGEVFPNRLYDVGIAEAHAVTFAAGLCAGGYRPVVAIYSTFLQRSYDNIIHDVALQKLPVIFCIDRAGLNAADGPTHHGIFDVSFLMQTPGMQLYAPISTHRLRELLHSIINDQPAAPIAIRYPAGLDDDRLNAHFSPENRFLFADGSYSDFDPNEPPSTLILTYGHICTQAILAKQRFERPNDVGIVCVEQLQPHNALLDALQTLLNRPDAPQKLIFLEEGIWRGGFSMNVIVEIQERILPSCLPTIRTFAIRDHFCSPSKNESVYSCAGIDADHILAELQGE